MSHLLQEIEWRDPVVPINVDHAGLSACRNTLGMEAKALQFTGAAPWIGEIAIRSMAWTPQSVNWKLSEIAAFVSAQENSCRYCYGAHRATLRLAGYSEDWIGRLEREVNLGDDVAGQAVSVFSRRLARSNPRPGPAEIGALEGAGLSAAATRELVAIVAFACFGNRVNTSLAVTPEHEFEAMAEKWWVRWSVPIVSLFRRYPKPVAPEVRASDYDGPYAPIAKSIGGPAGDVVADTLGRAFGDAPQLPLRSRLLVWGVVARGLVCPHCEPEARRYAARAGLSEEIFDHVLQHLDSPDLDSQERALVAWARHTVRYDPGTIQDRTRELAERIGPDLAVDAVGTAAVANAVIRMAMLAEPG